MIDDNPFHQDRDTKRFAFVCEKVTTFLWNITWIQFEIEIMAKRFHFQKCNTIILFSVYKALQKYEKPYAASAEL